MRVEDIARIAHEVNRGYCYAIGDDSQPPWDIAPEWQRQSAINGVQYLIACPSATPEHSHQNWLNEKVRDGWTWGPEKDAEAKRHPCMVPYHELPAEQRAKDHIFHAVVRELVRQSGLL